MHQHGSHKINETRKRSIVKTVSFHIVQVIVDAIILYSMVLQGLPPEIIALAGAVVVESVCLIGYFFWERLWNRIDWEREIVDG